MSSAAVGVAVARAVTICYFNYRKFRIWSESLVDASFLPSFLQWRPPSQGKARKKLMWISTTAQSVAVDQSLTRSFIHLIWELYRPPPPRSVQYTTVWRLTDCMELQKKRIKKLQFDDDCRGWDGTCNLIKRIKEDESQCDLAGDWHFIIHPNFQTAPQFNLKVGGGVEQYENDGGACGLYPFPLSIYPSTKKNQSTVGP